MRLVQLSDTYLLNLDGLREVTYRPTNGIGSARLHLYVGDGCEPTMLEGDEAVRAWRLLCDLCESPQGLKSGGAS